MTRASAHDPAQPRERPGLTRSAVVARALEIGTAEGLDAVSLRRIAQDLGVSPMALYRHVRDKQDLINVMTEVVLEGLDATVGFRPEMTWVERWRLALSNYKAQIDARPLALRLSIAYNGDGPPSFWKTLEDMLAILLEAGFERRQAITLIRMVSNLLAGYLLLFQQSTPEAFPTDPHQLDLLRRRSALVLMSLPRERFLNLVESADDAAEIWLSDPDRWWPDTVDLITFGLERMLERGNAEREQG